MKRALIVLFFLCTAAVAGIFILYPGSFFTEKEGTPAPLIIYVYKSTTNTSAFWQTVTDGVEAGSREYGYAYEILGAESEADTEGNITAVRQAIGRRPNAIVLSASNYIDLEAAAREASEAGIPLITIDSGVNGDWADCFIGSDNYEVGRLLGEELMARIGDTGKIALIGHVQGTESADERLKGALDALSVLDEARILSPVYCMNDSKEAEALLLSLLEAHPDICGVIATNENSALGVGMAVANMDMQDQIAVVSCDNAEGQISYLEQGVIDATIAQKPFNIGYLSVQIADKLLNGENAQVPVFYDTGIEVITVENMYTLENQKLLFPFQGQ